MRQERVRIINDTFTRLRGRRPFGTSWCRPESVDTTARFWRWGRCANANDPRHDRCRFRGTWKFWTWGRGVAAHFPSERRMMKRLWKAARKAA